jgi:hypothetical protein
MKAYRGRKALLIGERFTACPGYSSPRKEPQFPLNRKQGGPQSQLPYFEEEKNLLPLLGFKSQAYTYVPCCS